MNSYTWKSASSGSWNTAKNWVGGVVPPSPGAAAADYDTVNFSTGSNKGYTVNGTAQANVINIDHDDVKFSHFNLTPVFTGNYYIGYTLNLTNGADVTLSTDTTFSGGPGNIIVDQSKLTIYDTLRVVMYNKGYVEVSGSSATLIANEGHGANTSYSSAGSTINVINGGTFSSSGFTYAGEIDISGQNSSVHFSNTGYNNVISAGAKIVGEKGATLDGAFTNSGIIEAKNGLFKVSASFFQSEYLPTPGHFQIDKGATLELGANVDQDIVFLNNATLLIDKNISSSGFITGFGKGDSIDLANTIVTNISTLVQGGNTTLTAYADNTVVSTLKLTGSYTSNNLYAHNDGKGGTIIDYTSKPLHALDAIHIT